MIAFLAMTAPLALTCTVSSEGGIAGMVQRKAVPIAIEINDADFSASGHPDLDGLKNKKAEWRGDQVILLAEYESMPGTYLVMKVEAHASRIEWDVTGATRRADKRTLESHAAGICNDQPATVKENVQ